MVRYGERNVQTLLKNSGIVRNRLKIAAAIRNAKKLLEFQERASCLKGILWRYVDGKPVIKSLAKHKRNTGAYHTFLHDEQDLSTRGFKFIREADDLLRLHASVTRMVNDHTVACLRYQIGRQTAPLTHMLPLKTPPQLQGIGTGTVGVVVIQIHV